MITFALILGGLGFFALLLGLVYLRLKSAVESLVEPNLHDWATPPARQSYDERNGPQ